MDSLSRATILAVIVMLTVSGLWIPNAILPVHASRYTFGTAQNLSGDPSPSGFSTVATSGNNVYVAWLNNTSGNSNVLFRASNNNGSSFGPVLRVNNSTATGDSVNQEIAAAGSNVYVVWEQNVSSTSNHIFFRASTNSGTNFGPVIDISSNVTCGGGCSLATSTVPQIAAVANNVTIVWLATTNKAVNLILFKESKTNGSNLGTATALTLSTTAYGSTQPQVAAVTKYVYVVWSDKSPGRPQTFFITSSNGGTSFGSSRSLSITPTGETDLYQEITTSGNDVYVTWTNDTIASDNTMFATSTNNGASFGSALNLNKASVTDLYPALAASGSNVYIVWSDAPGNGNSEILYRSSSNNGASFGSILNMSNVSGFSNQQTIATSGNNVYVSWVQSGTPSDGVYFLSSSDSGSTYGTPLNLSRNTVSSGPVIGASGAYAYMVWEDDSTGNGDIYFVPTVFDFSINNSGPISDIQGGSGVDRITLALTSGSSQSVSLSCAGGLPSGVSCSFSPASGSPSFSSNLTIATQTSTPPGTYNVTVNGSGGTQIHSTFVTLNVSPGGTVGGTVVGVDKLAVSAPFLALGLVAASVMIAVGYSRRRHRKIDRQTLMGL